ncbi:MAG: 50S ribosomal protein L5, partial [Pseudomonadota bacterium]
MAEGYTPRMKRLYDDSVKGVMQEKFGYTNSMQMPK